MDFTRSYFASDRYSAKKTVKPVNFICLAPDAKQVTLTGDFNDWDPAEPWTSSLPVPRGWQTRARSARPRNCPGSQRGEGVVDRGELARWKSEGRNPKAERRPKPEREAATFFGFRPFGFRRQVTFATGPPKLIVQPLTP